MDPAHISSEAILRFLNLLPISGDVIAWRRGFRGALRSFLRDVDLVMVDVNYFCELGASYEPRPSGAWPSGGMPEAVPAAEGDARPDDPAARMLHSSNLRLINYHPPHIFTYAIGDNAYLGTIVLLRRRLHDDISEATLKTMEDLRSFMTFLLSDVVARHNLARPIDRAFENALEQIAREFGLNEQDREVLAVHLCGYPVQTIATRMQIAAGTVRNVIDSIHSRAGVDSYAELFSKYFTSHLLDRDDVRRVSNAGGMPA
ncbi:MAG TPA: hypothetical protein VHI13_00350 [Candidatus Kapabacteria bacterium]|nr:hypothetical protein [Candidatus Kapabacteria bacterium]